MNRQLVVLLAEDSSSDVLLAKRAFQKATATIQQQVVVQVVENGEAAIEYLSGTGVYDDRDRYPLPQMLFLDLKMPRKSGFEVMEWLQQQSSLKLIPIIVLSSSNEPNDIDRATQLGATLYLTKPLTLENLAPVFQTTLNSQPGAFDG
jgi:CheY-like chemotaxis protein